MWGSNSRPWRYQHHALPTELTDQLLLTSDKIKFKLAFSSLQDRILRAVIYFGKEWMSVIWENIILSYHPRYQTLQIKVVIASPYSAARKWTTRTSVVVPVEFRVNVLQRFCLESRETLLAFYEQKNDEKRATKKENKGKKNIIIVAKILGVGKSGYRSRYFPNAKRVLYELISRNLFHLGNLCRKITVIE